MRRPFRPAGLAATTILAAIATVLATVVAGCENDGTTVAPAPAASTTPLSELAPGSVTIARQQFCSRVAPAAVEQALGAPPASSKDYMNGERAELAPGVRDVAHEYGCTWTGADGTTLRAWLFAPPVTPGRAHLFAAAAERAKGCAPVSDAPGFGAPGVAVRCGTADGQVLAFHGLFGDAWLSCSLQTTAADALERTSRWCATVVQAASS